MTRFWGEKRRPSTKERDKVVLETYFKVMESLGETAMYVSKAYIYGKVSARTKLGVKTVANIINHVR